MKPLLPTIWLCVSATFLLAGCPDSRMPKTPPNVPEPKAVAVLEVPVNGPESGCPATAIQTAAA
jgi:hypothetical protein